MTPRSFLKPFVAAVGVASAYLTSAVVLAAEIEIGPTAVVFMATFFVVQWDTDARVESATTDFQRRAVRFIGHPAIRLMTIVVIALMFALLVI
jgi:hypothetical protein